MWSRWSCVVPALILAAMAAKTAPAQEQGGNASTATLRVNSRVVLTDVVVTDKDDHPVHGLKESDFQIFDNGRAEKLNAFEEHSGAPAANLEEASLPTGTHTNSLLLHAPPVINVLLIDTTGMEIVDQMLLAKELKRFVDQMPPGVPAAVVLRSYEFTVLLQDFTADHAALQAAIRKAIPHLPMPGGDLLSEAAGMEQVGGYLSQMPGRKNLLWFNSGTSLFSHPGPWSNLSSQGGSTDTDGSVPTATDETREAYDLLEAGRIAVYPIDVRGLNPQFTHAEPQQHLYESNFADATGGEAFYNENDMAKASAHAMENGDNYYTLSYSPDDLRDNGSWHAVRVNLAGGYHLTYRRGYYDETPELEQHAGRKDTTIRAGGQNIEAPNARSQPLIFRTQLAASNAPAKRDDHGYRVHFDIPAVELQHTVANGQGTATVGAAIVAFNQEGKVVSHVSQKVTLTFQEALYKAHPLAALSFDQQIDLPKRENAYLYVAVWDTSNGRMGTMDVQLDPKLVASGP